MTLLGVCGIGVLYVSSLSAQTTSAQTTSAQTTSAQTTQTCKFTNGPLSGQIKKFPYSYPTKVGFYCSDGLSSNGIAVPDKVRSAPPVNPKAPVSGSPTGDSGVVCKLTSGPLAGQTTFIPNDRLPILGAACSSGHSRGVVVPILE